MKLEDIVEIANRSSARPRGLNQSFPITITRTTDEDLPDKLTLFIRNDVNRFNSQNRWGVMWIESVSRLYFGYNINGLKSVYARQNATGGGMVSFINHDLAPKFQAGEKRGYYYTYDEECGLYYVDIAKEGNLNG